MRSAAAFFLASIAWAAPAAAQVNDAERAAARELFKQGDELQRSAHFDEALDKFQRAQQIFAAPTNELRIAECQAALGRLVESAEAYRAVLRTSLPPGSPQAFQAAVDQARAELEQVEPRVPKLTIVTQPAKIANPELQIDGQTVPAALLGEAMPLDPGPHKVSLSAAGYVATEASIVLKEHETRVALLTLKPAAVVVTPAAARPNAPWPPPPSSVPAPPPSLPPPPPSLPPPPPSSEPPPPPLLILDAGNGPSWPSWKGWLLGAHLGGETISGTLPAGAGATVDASQIVSGGFAYGLDAGFRFARRWYVGLEVEHSNFAPQTGVASAAASLVGAVIGVVVNPDRLSLYGEAGLAARWLTYRYETGVPNTYNGGEITLGGGLWIPAGRSLRLLPKLSFGFGTLGAGSSTAAADPGHAVVSLSLTGFYNIDL